MLETLLFAVQGILGLIVGMYVLDENLRKRLQLSEAFEIKAAICILVELQVACLINVSTFPLLMFEACLTVGGFIGLFIMFLNRPICVIRD